MHAPLRSIALVLALCPAARAQDMLGVSAYGFSYAVESSTGDSLLVGCIGEFQIARINALTITPTGAVYGMGLGSHLYGLDPVTGAATSLGNPGLSGCRGLAWHDASQTLLAVRASGASSPDLLWRLNPVTLLTEIVGSTGLEPLVALDTAPDGTLYSYEGGGGAGLVTLDPNTGASSDPFPAVPSLGNHTWLAVSASGEVFVGRNEIYRVDLTTGDETFVGVIPARDMRGLDFMPAPPVPWPTDVFCLGDGSGAPCPCMNESSVLAGCRPGFGYGGTIASFGSSSVAVDDLRIQAFGLTANDFGLLFQGNDALGGGNGVPFGDGLRCVGSEVVRLEMLSASPASQASSSVAIAAAGGVSPGDVRYYQVWFRDPVFTPCGAGFNFTNALRKTWTP